MKRTDIYLSLAVAVVTVVGQPSRGENVSCPAPPGSCNTVSCPAPRVVVELSPPEVVVRKAPDTAARCDEPCRSHKGGSFLSRLRIVNKGPSLAPTPTSYPGFLMQAPVVSMMAAPVWSAPSYYPAYPPVAAPYYPGYGAPPPYVPPQAPAAPCQSAPASPDMDPATHLAAMKSYYETYLRMSMASLDEQRKGYSDLLQRMPGGGPSQAPKDKGAAAPVNELEELKKTIAELTRRVNLLYLVVEKNRNDIATLQKKSEEGGK